MDNYATMDRKVCEFTDEEIGFLQDLMKEHRERVETSYYYDWDNKQEEDEQGEHSKYLKTMTTIDKIADKVEKPPSMSDDDWWDGWLNGQRYGIDGFPDNHDDVIAEIETHNALDRNDVEDRKEIKRIFDRLFKDGYGKIYVVELDDVITL